MNWQENSVHWHLNILLGFHASTSLFHHAWITNWSMNSRQHQLQQKYRTHPKKYILCPCFAWVLGLILGLSPANERHHYNVSPSLIGWVQIYNQPWVCGGLVQIIFTHILQGHYTGTRAITHLHWHQWIKIIKTTQMTPTAQFKSSYVVTGLFHESYVSIIFWILESPGHQQP